MEIVEYSEEYKKSIFEFTERCFEELGKKFEPDGRHSFYNDIADEFDVFYCVLEDNRVTGTVGLKKFNTDTVELKALYLDKGLRGQGIGRKLMDKAVSAAKELGYKSIVLDSMSKYKDARRLYERAGFKDTERYNDNLHADVFMRLEL